jgi:nitroimidazol reductase NimA-like FMN-containing flavoprotein (pyridoxamine 5'-phosphate oxidase superfamily)
MTGDQTGDQAADSTQSERTTVKRVPNRGHYDRSVIDPIIDEAMVCHVGIVHDGGPIVIPTLHARVDDHLILHGSPASRLLRSARQQEICATITLVDGFVLARSAFHHSMNYRSVVVVGQPEEVPADEKWDALDALVERLVPGRLPFLRPMTDKEVRATSVLRLPLTEASAKVRTGPPVDEPEDYELPIWAGVLPITTGYGPVENDPAMTEDLEVPDHVTAYARPR